MKQLQIENYTSVELQALYQEIATHAGGHPSVMRKWDSYREGNR